MTNLKNHLFFLISISVNQKIAENHMKQQAEADQFESRYVLIFIIYYVFTFMFFVFFFIFSIF